MKIPTANAAIAKAMYESGSRKIDRGRRELRNLGAVVPLGGRAFDILEAW
jgi:hypothetical protein